MVDRVVCNFEFEWTPRLSRCLFLKRRLTASAGVRDSVSGGSAYQRDRFVSINLHPGERTHLALISVPGQKRLKSQELPIIPYSSKQSPFALTSFGAAEGFCFWEMRNMLLKATLLVHSGRMTAQCEEGWSWGSSCFPGPPQCRQFETQNVTTWETLNGE